MGAPLCSRSSANGMAGLPSATPEGAACTTPRLQHPAQPGHGSDGEVAACDGWVMR